MDTLAHRQLWEAVADRLRDEILDGRLAAGSRLVEAELAERFGVSRGPVRDALQELARAGLAIDLPRRGTFVSSLTERDLGEVYEIRRAIEEAAVRLTVERASEADVASMFEALEAAEAAYGNDDLAAAWDADMAFHRSYCRLSGNGRLLELFDNLASQTVLLMRTTLDSHASLAWTPPVELHRRIAQAIAARDVDGATKAVGAHYQYTQDRLHASDPPPASRGVPDPGG
ncbi:MAG TPA: GntR family transcriptional regulator [Candidatus Limnocylindrales bacterium]|nr:GntR family transcriptional regulator [Candidatus Limnocylindrales bacterium]